MTRRVRAAAVVLALTALVVVVVMLLRDGPQDALPLATDVTVAVPPQIDAGDDVEVRMTAGSDGAVTLLVATSAGTVARDVQVIDGSADVRLTAPFTAVSGVMSVTAFGEGPSAIATVEVRPGPVAGIIEPLVGPRSVRVGDERLMVTTVPVDTHGNPVLAGTPVDVEVERPTGAVEGWAIVTDGMLAYRWVPAGTVSGGARVAVRSGSVAGPDVRYREVPTRPVDFGLESERVSVQADGTRSVDVRTDSLVDRFDNPLADGTSVVFRIDGPSGVSTVPALVVGGVATARLPVTDDGALDIVANIGGVTSAPLRLAGVPGASVVPVRRSGEQLHVGPVTDGLGALLPDGTAVKVRGDDLTVTTQLVDGRATVAVPEGVVVTITVAGTEVEG